MSDFSDNLDLKADWQQLSYAQKRLLFAQALDELGALRQAPAARGTAQRGKELQDFLVTHLDAEADEPDAGQGDAEPAEDNDDNL
jgi:hypothetical protein